MIITLDGPTASGKSSLARALAQKLGAVHFNSGFMYRLIGFIASRDYAYTLETIHAVPSDIVVSIMACTRYEYSDYARVIFDGHDITAQLKSAHVDILASCVSELVHVREQVNAFARALVEVSHGPFASLDTPLRGRRDERRKIQGEIQLNQQQLPFVPSVHVSECIEGSERARILIADGRDCGTVMFPDADYRFFITAAPEVRAMRWQKDQSRRGNVYTLEEALERIHERDYRDSNRLVAPLKPASDAIIIDSSVLSLQTILEQLVFIVHSS